MEVDQDNATGLDLGQRAKPVVATGANDLLFDEDRLKIYYNKVFPYQLMFKWISYNKLNT